MIYYKLLRSSLFFPLNNTPCVAEELHEYGLRATFQGNEEHKISQQCPLLLIPFPKACLELVGLSALNSGEMHYSSTPAQDDADLCKSCTEWKNTNQLQDESS